MTSSDARSTGLLFVFVMLYLLVVPLQAQYPADLESKELRITNQMTESAVSSLTSHGPILISSNRDFQSQGWPGNGTVENPYVIEGLSIQSEENCIFVTRTSVHFVVRDCRLSSGDDDKGIGIFLLKVSNAVLENITITDLSTGILVDRVAYTSISRVVLSNIKTGIVLDRSSDILVNQTSVSDSVYGVHVSKSQDCVIRDSEVSNSDIGVLTEGSLDVTLSGNLVYDCTHGFFIHSSHRGIVRGNTLHDLAYGVSTSYSDDCRLIGNEIRNSDYGAFLTNGDRLNATGNDVRSNKIAGIYVRISEDSAFIDNMIMDNAGTGLYLKAGSNCNISTNEIGYNSVSNAGDYKDATVIVTLENSWDGNAWGDYHGIPTYAIPGDRKSVDNCPHSILRTHSPDDVVLEFGETASFIWNISAFRPDRFEVSRNGEVSQSGKWNGSNLRIELASLDVGVYDYALTVNTTSRRVWTDTVSVSVFDSIGPVWIDGPEDTSIESGGRFSIQLTAYDPSGIDRYWVNNTDDFTIDLNGNVSDTHVLSVGLYWLEIGVADVYGNPLTTVITVHVVDTTTPIIDGPNDISIHEGTAGVAIVWSTFYDLNPGSYQILRNGTMLREGLWNSTSESLVISLDDLPPGTYVYSLILSDTSGNSVEDEVLVIVTPQETPTTETTTPTTTSGQPPTTTDTSLTSPQDSSMAPLATITGFSVAAAIVILVLSRRGVMPLSKKGK
ncbi:MAG: right-handed parallel beta-helix repeat-containing protein [Candidatus Thorarchaeota archaeon]|nr:MAG: right-handed parallel beta-helix repeat-containing protein [Candidatus Thorarchaeota archaeon]